MRVVWLVFEGLPCFVRGLPLLRNPSFSLLWWIDLQADGSELELFQAKTIQLFLCPTLSGQEKEEEKEEEEEDDEDVSEKAPAA